MNQAVSFRNHSACAATCFAADASCAHLVLILPDTLRLVSGFLLRIFTIFYPRQRKYPIC